VVKGHYGWESRQHLVGIITVDPLSGYLPHAFDCRGGLAGHQGSAHGQGESDNCYLRFKFHLLFLWLIFVFLVLAFFEPLIVRSHFGRSFLPLQIWAKNFQKIFARHVATDATGIFFVGEGIAFPG